MYQWIATSLSWIVAGIKNIPRLGLVRELGKRLNRTVTVDVEDGTIITGVLTKASVFSQTIELRPLGRNVLQTIPVSKVVKLQEALSSADSLEPSIMHPFTVVGNELKVTISARGAVTLSKKEIIIANNAGLDSYRDVFKCSTPWDVKSVTARIRPENVERGWQDSKMIPLPPGAGFSDVEYAHRVAEPFLKGRKYERISEAKFPEGSYLRDPSDWFEHVIRHSELAFSIEIRFPANLAPDRVEVVKVTELTNEEFIANLAVKDRRVFYKKQAPAIGEKYMLRWINSDDVRERLKEALKSGLSEADNST